MFGKHVAVSLPETLDERRRAIDVREEQGDRSGGELADAAHPPPAGDPDPPRRHLHRQGPAGGVERTGCCCGRAARRCARRSRDR